MSNVIKNKKDLEQLNYYLKCLNPDKIDKDLLEDILKVITPGDIKYNIVCNNFALGAQFVPNYKSIIINLKKFDKWLEFNYNDISNSFGINNDMLKNYLILYTLLHEVEHSYQYLMANNVVNTYDIVKYIYKKTMDLLIKKEYIIPRPLTLLLRQIFIIRYYSNQQFYALERNANVNSFVDVLALSIMNEQKDISKIFFDLALSNLSLGYIDNNMGCLYNTYKVFFLGKKYNEFDISNIKYNDKLIFGLKLSEQEHRELFQKINIKKNKFK